MLRNQLRARVTTRLLSTSEKRSTMASKNVETLRAAHESWNRRDFAGVVSNSAESLVYTDNARSLNLNGPDKFREWTEAWAKAFSDGRITKPEYIDAGDIVVARFAAEGTNDGPSGSFPLTGGKMSLRSAKSATSTNKGGLCRAVAT